MPTSDDSGVVLYEHNDYAGRAQPVGPGSYTRGDLDPLPGPGLRRPPGQRLRRPLTGDSRLHPELYASSQAAYEADAALWRAYERDAALRALPRVGSRAISSLRVPPGWSATLFADDTCEGQALQTFTGDVPSVGLLNDQACSVRVEGPPPAVPDPAEPDLLRDDVFSRSWVDRDYRHVSLVRHAGRLLMLAQDLSGAVVYAALRPDEATDSKGWPEVPAVLAFPRELSLVGFGVADSVLLPPVRRGATAAVPGEYVAPEEVDGGLSTTARLTADAPLQVVSDGDSLFVLRQSAGCPRPSRPHRPCRAGRGRHSAHGPVPARRRRAAEPARGALPAEQEQDPSFEQQGRAGDLGPGREPVHRAHAGSEVRSWTA